MNTDQSPFDLSPTNEHDPRQVELDIIEINRLHVKALQSYQEERLLGFIGRAPSGAMFDELRAIYARINEQIEAIHASNSLAQERIKRGRLTRAK